MHLKETIRRPGKRTHCLHGKNKIKRMTVSGIGIALIIFMPNANGITLLMMKFH